MSAKLLSVLGAIGITAIGSYSAFQLSPWPMALVLRLKLDRGGDAVAGALEQYVPPGVAARLQQRYADDPAAYLDVFYPAAVENTDQALPTVVWVHGGSWVSGSKDQVASYLRILAAKGFTTVGVDYALAPGETYPAPVRQVNAALGYLQQHAAALHVDPSKYFLAGDSAGAQIAGQLANAISAPAAARAIGIEPSIKRSQVRGVVLHCGTYDAALARFSKTGVLWAYFGSKDFMNDPRLAQFNVARNLAADFPAMFLSAGNADPLAVQSHFLAEKATQLGIPVDSLFFPASYQPPVAHEFQFDLDSDAGKQALARSVAFMVGRLR
jgi:acetyl esterase/lipase